LDKNIIIASHQNKTLDFDYCGLVDADQSITIRIKEKAKLFCNLRVIDVEKLSLSIEFILEGENSELNLSGIIAAKKNEQSNISIVQKHLVPSSKSTISLRAILQEKSRSDYRGLIYIAEGAKGSDAYQSYKALTVSPDAKAVSIPSLQVLNNDVQCGHATAVAHLDDDQLLYLMSRGICKKDAQKMIIKGFLAEQVDALGLPEGYEIIL
jgi:Fe-S cluster assembly scaffold protein SufB